MNYRLPTGLRLPMLLSIVSLMAVTGCNGDRIKVYDVAKENVAPAVMAQAGLPSGHPNVGAAGSGQSELTWKTPEGWEEMPLGQMRAASFKVTKDGKIADVSVIPLGGSAGGDTANVNRWREQAGLAALSAEDLKKTAEKIDIAGEAAELYDIAGTNPASGTPMRIFGAIQHRGGTAWFYKMTGDSELVGQHKNAFIQFLKSVQFAARGRGGAELPASHPPIEGASGQAALPASHPPIDGIKSSAGEPSSEGKPKWQVPSGWKEIAAGQFLAAKFAVGGDDNAAPAVVNVSMSVGDGGGVLANVNRWRGQLGLNSFSEIELARLDSTIDTPAGQVTIVDFTGTDSRTGKASRVVGAIASQSGRTWFYKLMGDAAVVEREKEAFMRFVKSVKY